ncbi:amino acid permease [Deltaproteobacteria bacterium]|nr:amino acid permease [Deltaproteobacteria bacterium]
MNIVPTRELSLFDSICIIVGIIIGAGIFEVTPTVASCMGGWKGILGIWLAGGLLALTGALCYAELATAYPHEGGDYVYQSRAYGSWAGYLFGWSQLVIIRPGDIALMAFVFARYAATLYAPYENMLPVYATMAVAILTFVNILGVKEGKWTQNLLTVIKSVGILAIIVAGLFAPARNPVPAETSAITYGGLELALILVLFTFGGWNEMAYVAAEVKHPRRNIVRSLVIGTILVTVLYILINGSFLHSLGQEKMSSSQAIAVDTLGAVAPGMASKAISILICISALGAVNGLIFTGARISYAMGAEHRSFRGMGKWSPRFGTPTWALIVQGCLSLAILLFAGSFIDTILYTAPVVWLFFLATGISVFVLRHKEPQTERPYKIYGFPAPAVIFCASCIFMLYSSVTYALAMKPIGLITVVCVLISGVFVYWFTDVRGRVIDNGSDIRGSGKNQNLKRSI